MTSTSNNSVLVMVLLGIFTGGVEMKKCSRADQTKIMSCVDTFQILGTQAGEFELSNKTSVKNMLEICAKFKKCSPSLSCITEDAVTHGVNISLMFCNSVDFFSNQFAPCQLKLDSKKTDCTENWDPYPDPVKNKKKMAELQKEGCKNYFGKDGCLRGEVIESCGEPLWKKFKKHFLALNTISETCKFKEDQWKNLD